jgi:hypothetical protein
MEIIVTGECVSVNKILISYRQLFRQFGQSDSMNGLLISSHNRNLAFSHIMGVGDLESHGASYMFDHPQQATYGLEAR